MNPAAAAGVVVDFCSAGLAAEGHKLVSYGSIHFHSSRPWRESEVVSSHPISVSIGFPTCHPDAITRRTPCAGSGKTCLAGEMWLGL
jgi:hypothetical protein